MYIGIGQIILLFVIAFLLFGNLSTILKEIAHGIKTFQEIVKK
jgi:Sec-independent protein translocase protein TatA